MRSLITLFRRSEAGSMRADDLRAALADIPLADREAALAEAEEGRRQALLTGTDGDIAKADNLIAGCVRDLDRARAATEELQRRIREAEKAERDEVEAQEAARLDQRAQEAADRIRQRYPVLVKELVELLAEAEAADRAVSEASRRGPVFRGIDHVEARVCPGHGLAHISLVKHNTIVGIPGVVEGWRDDIVQIRNRPYRIAAE